MALLWQRFPTGSNVFTTGGLKTVIFWYFVESQLALDVAEYEIVYGTPGTIPVAVGVNTNTPGLVCVTPGPKYTPGPTAVPPPEPCVSVTGPPFKHTGSIGSNNATGEPFTKICLSIVLKQDTSNPV